MKKTLIFISSLLITLSQDSPQGITASSITSLGSKISEFSSKATSSLNSLSSKFDSQQGFLSDTSEDLLTYEISTLESDLFSIDSSISTVTSALELAENNCPEHLDCRSCTSSSSCVWCSVDKLCTNGDSEGPFEGECSDYLYETCSLPGCSEHTECELCISDIQCGWCSLGHICYEATTELIGDCDFQYFYYIEGNNVCPEYKSQSKSTSVNTQLVLQSQLAELEELREQVNNEIQDINDAISDIVEESMEKARTVKPMEGSDYTGLVERTERLAEEEISNEKLFEDTLWEAWPNVTANATSEEVTEDFDGVIIDLQKYQNNVKEKTKI